MATNESIGVWGTIASVTDQESNSIGETDGTDVEQRPARGRNAALMVVILLAVAAVDQATKQYMLSTLTPGEPVPVIGDWFRWLLIFNPGAAFGMGEDATWLFTTIQLAFVVATLFAAWFIHDRPSAVGFALIGGGALGNLIDRLAREPGFWFGHVVDFISIGDFAIFNLADASINIGVVVFVIAILTEGRRHGA